MRRYIYPSDNRKSSKGKENSSPIVRAITKSDNQRRALDLKVAGYSHSEIAAELGIPYWQVPNLLFESLEEYKIERDEAAKRFIAVTTHRYEMLHKKWWPLAMGYTDTVEGPQGETIEVHHPPDPDAAKIVLKAMADAAKVLGLQKLRVEHTGANGGAIRAEIDWTTLTDEQIAKLSRGDFSVLHAHTGTGHGAGASRNAPTQADETGKPPQTH